MHNFDSHEIGWIGFLKDAPTDQFMWADGTPADFLAWGPGGRFSLGIDYVLLFC